MGIKSFSSPLILSIVLSACSGGGGDDGIEADVIGSLATRVASADPVDPGDLPDEAMMSGYIGLAIDSDLVEGPVYGQMDVVADFMNGDISGIASNLAAYEVGAECLPGSASCEFNQLQSLDGELVLSGMISGITFDGNLSGALMGDFQNGGASGQFSADIDATVTNGEFLIDDEGLLGVAVFEGDATIISPLGGEATTVDMVDANGGFTVAE